MDISIHPNVIIYNLWSCAELIIDAKLYLIAELSEQNKKHGYRIEKLKLFSKTSGIFSNFFCGTFFKLADKKNPARYGGETFAYSGDDIRSIIKNLDEEIISITI